VRATAAELHLDPARLTSDLEEFRKAIAAKQWFQGAALYAGPFLDAFYLNDAPEFERWVDTERAVLAREGARVIERAAHAAEEGDHADEAAEQWQRLTRLDPLNGAYAVAYMQALARRGDRSGAIAHGDRHVELVRQELEADPDPDVVRLIASLRDRPTRFRQAEASNRRPQRETAPQVRYRW
jgi:DNA-binding SARP family transcriptional activator